MSFATWFFERVRAYTGFRWYYNPRWININYGKEYEPFIRALLKARVQDATSKIEDAQDVPPQLEEIRQAYERKSIDVIEDFRNETGKLFEKLNVVSEKGETNTMVMRRDMSGYLKSKAFAEKWKSLVWVLFILGVAGLASIDFAPSLLIFEALMEGDAVSIGALFGLEDDLARSMIMILSTAGFLIMIAFMGHVIAKVAVSSYFDGEIPIVGIFMFALMIFMFYTVSSIRYQHELKVAEESYQEYVHEFEKKQAMGISLKLSEPISIDEWTPGYQTRSFFNSAIFVMISAMIFIVAIYLSFWRMYGDVRFITRQFKQNKYRVKCAEYTSQLRFQSEKLNNSWENLRQSAQIEVEQFLIGIKQGMIQNVSEYNTDQIKQVNQFISSISKEFSARLNMPQSYFNAENTSLPSHEEEWGMRYTLFYSSAISYDVYCKGALDAIMTGKHNPNSAMDGITKYFSNKNGEKSSNWLPALNDEELLTQYNAGFDEGKVIKNGAAYRLGISQPSA